MAGTALRRIGIAAAGFVGLLIIVLLGISGISRSKMNRTYVIKAETLELKSDSATMAQAQRWRSREEGSGSRFARDHGCSAAA